MNAYDTAIEQVVSRIAWSLVHFLWQGTTVAFFLQTALWLARVRRPSTRYAMCLSGLFVMVACPVTTICWVQPQIFESDGTQHGQRNEIVDGQGTNSSDKMARALIASEGHIDLIATRLDVFVPKDEVGNHRPGVSDHRWWSRGIVIVWLCGVGVFTMRLLLGWIGIVRICQQVEQVPEWLNDRLGMLADRLKTPAPLLRISSRLTEAVAVGILKPMILIPITWITALPPDMIEAVIVHELVHLRRRDLWVNLFQRLAETLLFYHPAVWWLSRRIRIERELCCDEQVVRILRSSVRYAETLEQIGRLSLEASSWNSRQMAAVTASICGSRRVLLQRIQAILLFDPKRPAASGRIAGLATLIPAVFVLGTLMVSNLVPANDQTEPQKPEPEVPAQEIPLDADTVPEKQSDTLPADAELFFVIPKGKSRSFEFQNRLTKVDGHDADMIRVTPVGTKALQVEGLTPGLTLMICTDDLRTEFAMVVEVIDGDTTESDVSPYLPRSRMRPLPHVKIRPGANEIDIAQGYTIEFEFPEPVTTVDGVDKQIVHVDPKQRNSIQVTGLAIGKATMKVNQEQFTIQIDVSPQPKTRPAFRKIFANQGHQFSLQQDSGSDRGEQPKLVNHPVSGEVQVAPQTDNDGTDRIRSQLGLRLTGLPDFEQSGPGKTRYRGGMHVLEVKADSAADVSGFTKGPIFVGLDKRFSKDLEFADRITNVDGHDPEVISVVPVGTSGLRVRGLSQGVTTMIVTGASNQRWVIEVYVNGDARLLQSVLKRSFPDSAVTCSALQGDSILLTGYATNLQTITQIMEVARVYSENVINHIRVGDREIMNVDKVKWILEELGKTQQPAEGKQFYVVRLQQIQVSTLQLPAQGLLAAEGRLETLIDPPKTPDDMRVAPQANNDGADRIWSQLGLRLQILPKSELFELGKTRYRGGMRVLEVKPDSPAYVGGFKKDDILVGLDKWETMNFDNIKWILDELGKTQQSPNGAKFFVVRQQEIRIGNLQVPVSSRTGPLETLINSTETKSEATNPSLDKLIDRALSATYERQLVATGHSPWQIMQGIKAFGLNWPIHKESRSGETITAAEWIASGPKFNHETVWIATNDGARAHPFTKPFYFESHPGQFLAWLAAADVPTNFQLKAFRDGSDLPMTVTVGDLLSDLKFNLDQSAESWGAFWALAYYEPIDSSWIDKQGIQWTIEKRAAQEASWVPVGGCPRLFALAIALKKYRVANNPSSQTLPNPWREVNKKLIQFAEKVKSWQNSDGSFSTGLFSHQELSHDINVRLATTGSQLAWLAVALPDNEMTQDWIERATRVLAEDLLESRSLQIDVGSMSDAAYALKLVHQRRFNLAAKMGR